MTTIREATPEDAGAIASLFQRVFHERRTEEYLRWAFQESPAGPGHVVVAVAEGQVVAQAATITRQMVVAGRLTLCGQSVDAMTDPRWQRQGLNQRLSATLFDLHERDGVDYIYGFSNRNSTHTVLTHQGRVPLEPFPALVRPLRILRRPWRVVVRRDRPLDAGPCTVPDDAGPLWKAERRQIGVSVVRDVPYLRWRYRRPGGVYIPVELREAGRLRGFAILGLRTQMGMRTAFVMEALAEPGARRQLLGAIVDAASSADCDAVSALSFPGATDRRAFLRAGFVPIPGALNPEDIVLSIRRGGGRAFEAPVLEPSAWRLSWGEHDVL